MKTVTTNFSLRLIVLFAVITLAASCGKQATEGTGYYPREIKVEDADLRMAQEMANNLPEIGIYNEETETIYRFNLQTRDFSFADANDGWNFSNSDGPVFVESPEGGGVLIIPSFSFGANSGGTVVAGSSAIDIDYTFCFSASDEALGLDLFDYGGNLDGISLVLGIGGDFEALMDDEFDEDADFSDFFHGYAMYFVYDNEASGTYEILNWLDDIEGDLDDLDQKGFSYVLDFQNFNLYFSADGTLNVSGGEMSFTGEYLGLLEIFESLEEDEDVDFDLVSGFGTMGCN